MKFKIVSMFLKTKKFQMLSYIQICRRNLINTLRISDYNTTHIENTKKYFQESNLFSNIHIFRN